MTEIYCLKCRKATGTIPNTVFITAVRGRNNKNFQPMIKGVCLISNTKKNKFLPMKPLTDIDIKEYARGISDFRGVFSRDNLPEKAELRGSYIINLDSQDGKGTHWVACHVNRNEKYYFDSFGLPPPKEIVKFLNDDKNSIVYNTSQVQNMTEVICGHLCLMVLFRLNHGALFQEILDDIL